jgi:hypothetical protein
MFTPEGRAAREARIAAQLDSEECVARCMHCPDFHMTGTSAEVIRAQATHRAKFHPAPPKPRKGQTGYTTERRRAAGQAASASNTARARERRERVKPLILDLLRSGPKSKPELRRDIKEQGFSTSLKELRDAGQIRIHRQRYELT